MVNQRFVELNSPLSLSPYSHTYCHTYYYWYSITSVILVMELILVIVLVSFRTNNFYII